MRLSVQHECSDCSPSSCSVFYCTYENTSDLVKPVVNCKSKHLTHRDVNAAFNIMQIRSLLLSGRPHPSERCWLGPCIFLVPRNQDSSI